MSNSTEDGTQRSEFEETGSASKTLDAALLNRHLEWLLQVGFSADMILEWAREKQVDDVDDPIPIPDPEPDPQDSQLNSFPDDSSYDNDEGQLQSQESESQFTLSIHTPSSESTSLATGCVRKRKHKESSCELSASRAKKQRLTEESLFRGATTNRQKKVRMRKLMLKILSKLEKLPEAANFIEFDNADDYDDIIDYPMCIREIKDRINRFQCDSHQLFCAEFDAIIKNCRKYYKDNPIRLAQAKKLKIQFDRLVKKYLPDDSHLQPLEEGLPLNEDGSDEDEAQKGSGSSSSSESEEEAEGDSEEMGSNSCINGDDTIAY